MWMAKNSTPWGWLSLGLLLAGAGIYAGCRPLPWMPWGAALPTMPGWLLFGLPDGLWAAAFAAALLEVLPARSAAWSSWSPAGYLLLTEGLQGMGLWPGTADLLDVAWGFGGCGFIFCIYYLQKAWKTGKEKQLTCL
jgi:hypothetical protein